MATAAVAATTALAFGALLRCVPAAERLFNIVPLAPLLLALGATATSFPLPPLTVLAYSAAVESDTPRSASPGTAAASGILASSGCRGSGAHAVGEGRARASARAEASM